MGADYYESEEQRQGFLKAGKLPIGIGEGSTISNTIVDKNARIGRNCQITNKARRATALPCTTWCPCACCAALVCIACSCHAAACICPVVAPDCKHLLADLPAAPQEGIDEANREDEGFYIRSGIVTVLRNAEVVDGTVL